MCVPHSRVNNIRSMQERGMFACSVGCCKSEFTTSVSQLPKHYSNLPWSEGLHKTLESSCALSLPNPAQRRKAQSQWDTLHRQLLLQCTDLQTAQYSFKHCSPIIRRLLSGSNDVCSIWSFAQELQACTCDLHS